MNFIRTTSALFLISSWCLASPVMAADTAAADGTSIRSSTNASSISTRPSSRTTKNISRQIRLHAYRDGSEAEHYKSGNRYSTQSVGTRQTIGGSSGAIPQVTIPFVATNHLEPVLDASGNPSATEKRITRTLISTDLDSGQPSRKVDIYRVFDRPNVDEQMTESLAQRLKLYSFGSNYSGALGHRLFSNGHLSSKIRPVEIMFSDFAGNPAPAPPIYAASISGLHATFLSATRQIYSSGQSTIEGKAYTNVSHSTNANLDTTVNMVRPGQFTLSGGLGVSTTTLPLPNGQPLEPMTLPDGSSIYPLAIASSAERETLYQSGKYFPTWKEGTQYDVISTHGAVSSVHGSLIRRDFSKTSSLSSVIGGSVASLPKSSSYFGSRSILTRAPKFISLDAEQNRVVGAADNGCVYISEDAGRTFNLTNQTEIPCVTTGLYTQVAVGEDFIMALKNTGLVIISGFYKTVDGLQHSMPSWGISGIRKICAGPNWGAFVTKTKLLYTFGANDVSQTGRPKSLNAVNPTPLHTSTVDVACGDAHGLAIDDTKNVVFGWGSNAHGQVSAENMNVPSWESIKMNPNPSIGTIVQYKNSRWRWNGGTPGLLSDNTVVTTIASAGTTAKNGGGRSNSVGGIADVWWYSDDELTFFDPVPRTPTPSTIPNFRPGEHFAADSPTKDLEYDETKSYAGGDIVWIRFDDFTYGWFMANFSAVECCNCACPSPSYVSCNYNNSISGKTPVCTCTVADRHPLRQPSINCNAPAPFWIQIQEPGWERIDDAWVTDGNSAAERPSIVYTDGAITMYREQAYHLLAPSTTDETNVINSDLLDLGILDDPDSKWSLYYPEPGETIYTADMFIQQSPADITGVPGTPVRVFAGANSSFVLTVD